MHPSLFPVLDVLFIVFHTLLILFSLIGWIWYRTRRIHLIILLFIAFFWFIMGMWYGIGYCPCTDWHWQIRRELGDYVLPYSYIKFLLDSVTGLNWDAALVDYLTGTLYILAVAFSIVLNVRDWLKPDKRQLWLCF